MSARDTWLRIAALAACVVATSRTPALGQISIAVEPQNTRAPALITISGSIDSTYFASIDYGDGSSQYWYDNTHLVLPFDVALTHEYNCPGDYAVHAVSFDGTVWWDHTWTIHVATPSPLQLITVVSGNFVTVTTPDLEKSRRTDRAVVDWGDGTALEEFVWVSGNTYFNPSHVYTAAGAFAITITNQYLSAQCGLVQSATRTVTIENPNATRAVTWGHIKSLYR